MGLQNRYTQVLFRILWDNVQIATLRISPKRSLQATIERRSGQKQNNTEDLPFLQYPGDSFGAPQNNDYSHSVNGTSLMYGDLTVDCLYHEDRVDLNVTEVLGAVVAGLKSVVPVSKTDRMDGIFTTNVEGIDSKVSFGGQRCYAERAQISVSVRHQHPAYNAAMALGSRKIGRIYVRVVRLPTICGNVVPRQI